MIKILFLIMAVSFTFTTVFGEPLNSLSNHHGHNHDHAHDNIEKSCLTCLLVNIANNLIKLSACFLLALFVFNSQFLIKFVSVYAYFPSPVLQKVRFNT